MNTETDQMLDDPLANLVAGPEVGASVKPQPSSLARDLIVKYVAGKDAALDQKAAAEVDSASAPTTSRQWSNREAKEAAKKFLLTPKQHFSTLTFDEIWGHVLRSEGGYSNNPADPGGETKFGISKRSYANENIAAMTPERAQEIFKSDFYDAVGGDSLMKINPGLAAHVSDMAFNAGPKAAVKLMYDAVQLPRQSQITPELLDRLNDSENLIKDYSVARLKYYASLGNAPTFIKGWVNRVNNLNKALQVKSGLNGAYKAARAMDVQSLVGKVYSAQDQLAPKFRELDQIEMERLSRANEMLSPGYHKPAVQPKTTSSVADVFKATYDAKYYTNTIDGMNELANRSAREASEANRKAMGDKFDKGMLETLTAGLYGGINSVKDFETEVAAFKAANPGVKLPFDSVASVYAKTQERAKEIEDKYNSLDSGSFTDGIAASLNKLGHVVAGYLPGEILGSLSDRLEGALGLAPLPGTATAAGVAKGALAVMAGTGAAQTVVQPMRQDLGLEGGLKEGLVNTVTAGVGQAVLGTLANLGTKLWRSGSKDTAKEVFKEAERLKKAIASDIPSDQHLQLQRASEDLVSHAKELDRNPYGTDHNAKLKYEENRAAAMEDILAGRPVREMDATPTHIIDNTQKLKSQFSQMYNGDEIVPDYSAGIKEWAEFKKSMANPQQEFQATVPIEGPDGVSRFKTKEELQAYMKATDLGEEIVLIEQAPDGTWYAARPADLESMSSQTSRFDQDSEVVGNVRGFIGSDDVDLAKRYPDLVKTRDLAPTQAKAPTYPTNFDEASQLSYFNELSAYGSSKMKDLDKRYEVTLKQLGEFDPEYRLDIGEHLGDDMSEMVSSKEMAQEFTEQRTALQEMFSCMVGGPTTTQ